MSSPLRQLPMMSRGPPSLVATIGSPDPAASSSVSPNGSVNAGLMNTPRRAVARRYSSGTSAGSCFFGYATLP